MYVDDMTIFVSDEQSGNHVFELLHNFGIASGLKVNVDKTEGVWLGQNKNYVKTPYGIRWPKEPIKALGIYFSYDKKAAENYNFVSKLEKLSRQLHWWKARDLTIIGKVLITKVYGLSTFNFAASVLHIPKEIIQKVDSLLYQFLWGTKSEKVKRDIVNQDYALGGLQMLSFDMCNKSAKIKWIKSYLDPKTTAVWKDNFQYICKKTNLSLYLLSDFMVTELSSIPLYYKDSISFWRHIKSEIVYEKQDLNNQLVWYNINILINNKSVFNDRLFKCGLWNVNDLYNDGELIPFDTWQSRGAFKCDYMLWRGIIKSLPNLWNILVKGNDFINDEVILGSIVYGDDTKNISCITEKEMKNCFKYVAYNKLTPCELKAQAKYTDMFKLQDDVWSDINMLPFKVIFDNKIIDLQYRILHRYIGTNHLLHKIGKKNSPNCEACMMFPETIEHIFFECFIVKNFWFELFGMYSEHSQIDVTIKCEDILLQYNKANESDNIVVNVLILYGKKCIYYCKMKNVQIHRVAFARYLTRQLHTLRNVKCAFKEHYLHAENFMDSIN